MYKKIIYWSLLLYFCIGGSISHAGWLIYHKPEFKGKIIEAETGNPIEGAVVAVLYTKDIMSPPDGSKTRVIHTKEALTDKNGEFVIPSYTTLIQPFSFESYADFIIYKPGYRGYSPIPWREFFLKENFGRKGEWFINGKNEAFIYGILKMKKLETAKERIRAIPSIPFSSHVGIKELPQLFRLKNQERKRFGLGEVKW